MQEDPAPTRFEGNPLVKDVAGHLFAFEEKIFGMSLTQLLIDLGILSGSFSLTGALPLLPRLLVCALITLLFMGLVHGKVGGLSLFYWLTLLLRSKTVPTTAVWLPRAMMHAGRHKGVRRQPSVQATWVPLDTLEQGMAATFEQRAHQQVIRYWTAFEVEGKNLHLLPTSEQVRAFGRFEHFLTGLEFHLHLLSLTEQIDPRTAPALLRQHEALGALTGTPRLAAWQRASLAEQERAMAACSRTRHFLLVCASSTEAALQYPDGPPPSVLSAIGHLLTGRKRRAVSRRQVLDQLRIRASVLQKAIQQVELRIWPLHDHELLHMFASCLAPGVPCPSFLPAVRQQPTGRSSPSQADQEHHNSSSLAQPSYQKCLKGLHGTFYYSSSEARTRLETERLVVADLIAPSRVTIAPNVVQIQAGTHTRYLRVLVVTGYGHQVACGWVNRLHDLGVPLLVSTHLEPIDSRFIIKKLEYELTKLESQRLSDQKALRLTRADQQLEAEQIRRVTRALAARSLKLFEVSLTIGVHTGSLERLEQRCRYVLSHLREMHIQARSALLQQDLAWQSCLPTGLDLLQPWVKLTSDVVSTFLPATSGTIGTPTGVFLGYSRSGLAQRPVYLHPWSTDKKLANPHIVVIGETGMGKSWFGKTLATGLMGLGLADVCVLDKDDDYLPLHQAMPTESQRYALARGCPINLFDLPFGPADVDPDDGADLLAEFFDNTLLTGLALLITEEEGRLSRSEEAYLLRVARAAYAACGISSEAIRERPETVLLAPPTLSDFIATMHTLPASSEEMRQSLLERLARATYLFGGQTRISLEKPLTIFSIRDLDSKWFALMTFVVHTFLRRHRALKQDERYLAYIVEEASYLLKHVAGRRYLESGSRGFRKLGIAQITLSQHPRDFLEAGQVVLSNAGTVCYLGMQQTAAQRLHLPEELERLLVESVPGQGVLRVGNEYAPLSIWSNPRARALFTTDPAERRAMRQRRNHVSASPPHARTIQEAPQREQQGAAP